MEFKKEESSHLGCNGRCRNHFGISSNSPFLSTIKKPKGSKKRGGVQTSEFSTSRHLADAVTTECGVRAEIRNRRGRDRKSCSETGNRAELAEQQMEAREEIDFLL
nr:hypothetical protein Iba_scaffold2820CG0080 [Ipomoea batatas]